MPRSIAPESVLTLCGLFCLSSALRRHVKIPKKYLGGWENYPHLYITLVADPGVITKSTSIGFVEDLLDELPHITRTPESFTVPIIGVRLKKAPDASLCMIVPEFGTVAEKSGIGLYTVLTNLFDGKKRFDEETISRELVFAASPIVNMLAATTPDWIGDNMPNSILNGGFGSRTIFLHEKAPRQKRLLYHRITRDEAKFDKLRSNLIADLNHISENVNGDFEFDSDETADWFENWYQEIENNTNASNRRIKGYLQRKPAYVMKVAMLLTISSTDNLILYRPILENAIQLMEGLEKKMVTAFKHVGKNKYSVDIDSLAGYIKTRKKAPHQEILEEFQATAEPMMLESLLGFLMQTKKIKMFMEAGSRIYAWNENPPSHSET